MAIYYQALTQIEKCKLHYNRSEQIKYTEDSLEDQRYAS